MAQVPPMPPALMVPGMPGAPAPPLEGVAGLTCAIDVSQALLFLGKGGTTISGATLGCPVTDTDTQKAGCSAAVSSVIFSFGFAATFISAAAAECSTSVNNAAVCAADVSNLVASLAVLSAVSSSLHNTCRVLAIQVTAQTTTMASPEAELPLEVAGRRLEQSKHSPYFQDTDTPEMKRFAAEALRKALEVHRLAKSSKYTGGADFERLMKETHAHSDMVRKLDAMRSEEDIQNQVRGTEIADCVIDAANSLFFLIRAGLAISAAASDCTPTGITESGIPDGQMVCSTDIFGFIQSISFAATFIAVQVSQ